MPVGVGGPLFETDDPRRPQVMVCGELLEFGRPEDGGPFIPRAGSYGDDDAQRRPAEPRPSREQGLEVQPRPHAAPPQDHRVVAGYPGNLHLLIFRWRIGDAEWQLENRDVGPLGAQHSRPPSLWAAPATMMASARAQTIGILAAAVRRLCRTNGTSAIASSSAMRGVAPSITRRNEETKARGGRLHGGATTTSGHRQGGRSNTAGPGPGADDPAPPATRTSWPAFASAAPISQALRAEPAMADPSRSSVQTRTFTSPASAAR